MSEIDAVAEYIGSRIAEPCARCGTARCGMSYCGDDIEDGPYTVYAGMVPEPRNGQMVAALTERPGGPADPRRSAVRYTDPAYTLHLIGDDLTVLDRVADKVRALDRTAHIMTMSGEINTFRVLPPERRMGMRRPRYDVTLGIDAEVIKSGEIKTITIGTTPFEVVGGVAVMTSEAYLAACGFEFRQTEV